MTQHGHARLGLTAVAAALFAVGFAGQASGVAAQSSIGRCKDPTALPTGAGTKANGLFGVAAISGCKAWAVGSHGSPHGRRSLIEYWNGKAWKTQRVPRHGRDLFDVAATSPTNAWAVGRGKIMHWNGKAWKLQKSPTPPRGFLDGVAATSRTNAWAVGTYRQDTLIEHWNGKAWKVQKSPYFAGLHGVTAISATNAWAVGSYTKPPTYKRQTLILHWNGKAWKMQKSPNPGGPNEGNFLYGVAAISATNAWAVGADVAVPGDVAGTVILHWNGKAWTVQPSPNPSGATFTQLDGVAATSATNAWAVGFYQSSANAPSLSLIERWNGKGWMVQKSPNPGGPHKENSLSGVAATSANNAWAVGEYGTYHSRSVALHWSGTAWSP